MKLRRLYTNMPRLRPPIVFHDGLNVVLGEIRHPKNLNRDTHNLGKSLLAQLIDFCLLKKKDKKFFLFRHKDIFEDFAFFLELETPSGTFVTVRRAVETGSKASLMLHALPDQDFTDSPKEEWTHWLLPFNRAVQALDGYLALDAVRPWDFRNIIGYSLRSQKDYDQPFKLSKFVGKQAEWKPLLAHVIGLDAKPISRSYEIEEQVEHQEAEEKRLTRELQNTAESADQLRGRLQLREETLLELERAVANYDFDLADAEINQELVDKIDFEVGELNDRRYYVTSHLERIKVAQAEQVVVSFDQIRSLFEQVQVYFTDALVKDYRDLERFSRAISQERREYLEVEQRSFEGELQSITAQLKTLNQQRSAALAALTDKETFSKFRKISARLIEQRTEVELLREKTKSFERLAAVRRRVRELKQEHEALTGAIEAGISSADGKYAAIRHYFNEILEEIISRKASLYTHVNAEGHVEFHTEILDAVGHETSAADGNTYGRLLCMAFDLAVARAHLAEPFPHFLYHDGALETLDNRKKFNLIRVLRDYSALGLQIIITVIDSELPWQQDGQRFEFAETEICLKLNDDGPNGRLFRMATW
jgi:uncharacterized protein YydD (DUF2326 family)